MTDDFDKMLWAYRAVFTQTNAGGGTIRIKITARERMEVLYGTIGRDDYAATRAVYALVTDSAGNVLGQILFSSAVDNQFIPLIDGGSIAALTGEDSITPQSKLVIGRTDILEITTEALVQNETVTVAIRALVSSAKPSVATTGSGGTVTITTTYDKVI